MLHNKYFEVLKQFVGDYNRQLYGRELIGKVKLSQKGIALALEELEEKLILKSRKQGTLRYYHLNQGYSEIRDILAIVEIMKKIEFLSKQRKTAYLFKSDSRIVGIFGSYAKGTQKEESDIDVFIIGKKKKKDYDGEGKAIDLNISLKYFSQPEWMALLRQKNNLCNEILSQHVILFGVEAFIDLAWRGFYGFS